MWEKIENFILKYGLFIFSACGSLFIIGSLWSFNPTDTSWFYHTTDVVPHENMFGFVGANCAALFVYLFGRAAFLFIPALCYSFLLGMKKISFATEWDRFLGMIVGFLSSTLFCQVYHVDAYVFSHPGGLVGNFLMKNVFGVFDSFVQKVIVFSLLAISAVLIIRFSFISLVHYALIFLSYLLNRDNMPARTVFKLYHWLKKTAVFVVQGLKKIWNLLTGNVIKNLQQSVVEFEQEDNVDEDIEMVVEDLFWQDYVSDLEKKGATKTDFQEEQIVESDQQNFLENDLIEHDEIHQENSVEIFAKKSLTKKKNQKKLYQLPAISAHKINESVRAAGQEKLQAQAKILEEKLEQFGIKGKVVAMHAGPVVALFEYQPDIKVKVSKILALEDDLAMALKALSIRIIAPIPGRAVVGFEVANVDRKTVVLSNILDSNSFKKFNGFLPMILGKDTLGEDVIVDLAKMPHLLIAGSTGSGKSVALNAMLISLLCALKPEDLKLIIIDPKRLEFSAYEDIAHLLFPIVTDTKKAVPILKWVVKTMEDRYKIMAQFGVRNLLDYQKAAQKNKEMEPMPLIVVIIDELADLMMTAGKAVEDSIARIAQMARAAGIHMIVATQRPSVDVITGMIKVNFSNRVSFKVTSKVDSRTILDVAGAEKLLGRGDMLFLDSSQSNLVRVHGAYISDDEIHKVVDQIRRQQKVSYLDISNFFAQQEDVELLDGDDELYGEIVELIKELDEVSISMLQRRFRIGYNRSARIISLLESKGLIMPAEGGKTRRVVKE